MLPELRLRISSRMLPAQEWDSGCPCFSSSPSLEPVGPETCVCVCGVCVCGVCVCVSKLSCHGNSWESLSFLSGAASTWELGIMAH